MEQGNMDQNDIQITGEKIVSQEGTNEYKVYEHPLLPKRIVKIGVCWLALIVGPAYLIYRRLWVPVVVWIVAIGLVRYLAFISFQICDGYGNNCYLDADGKTTVEQFSEGAIFVGLVLLLFMTNSIWEKDLINRGYSMTKSLRARSMDDALAILEREKNPLLPIA